MTNWIAITLKLLVCTAIWLPVAGQTFEVASIKPIAPDGVALGGGPRYSNADRINGGPGTADPQRISYGRVSIKRVLMIAYDLKEFQISGPPAITEQRFDIEAIVPAKTSVADFHLMLRNLLAERFNLRASEEIRELPVYELTVAKTGTKLTPSGPMPPNPSAEPTQRNGEIVLPDTGGMSTGMRPDRTRHLVAKRRAISKLTEYIENLVAKPVIDKTGLTDSYDFALDFNDEGLTNVGTVYRVTDTGETRAVAPEDLPPAGGKSLSAALEQQLGLKLEAKKGPVQILIVDQVGKLREN